MAGNLFLSTELKNVSVITFLLYFFFFFFSLLKKKFTIFHKQFNNLLVLLSL